MGQSGAITSLKNNRKQVKKRNYFDSKNSNKGAENTPDLKDHKKATPEQLDLIRMQQKEYKRQQFYKKIMVFTAAGTITVISFLIAVYILRQVFEF